MWISSMNQNNIYSETWSHNQLDDGNYAVRTSILTLKKQSEKI